ncbi:hypothetical protein GALL_377560 [mine drainage metagenome]|uniref:Uncharacterized protein n=1 Tax=mine drainage metagenome TaxID=410659 RepID=A0A1J5QBB7_9ZZZZ
MMQGKRVARLGTQPGTVAFCRVLDAAEAIVGDAEEFRRFSGERWLDERLAGKQRRLFLAPRLRQQRRKVIERRHEIGIAPQRPAVRVLRPGEVLLTVQDCRQIVPDVGVASIQRHRSEERRCGIVELPRFDQNVAQIVVARGGPLAAPFDRLQDHRDAARRIALLMQQHPQVMPRLRMLRIALENGAVAGLGFGKGSRGMQRENRVD